MTKRINQVPERNESWKPRGLRNQKNKTWLALATILGASITQSWDWNNFENWQIPAIPESKVLSQEERQWVWYIISEWVNLVIPSAHANTSGRTQEAQETRKKLEITREMVERLKSYDDMVKLLNDHFRWNASRAQAFGAINIMEDHLRWLEENQEYSDRIDYDWIQGQRRRIEEQTQRIE